MAVEKAGEPIRTAQPVVAALPPLCCQQTVEQTYITLSCDLWKAVRIPELEFRSIASC